MRARSRRRGSTTPWSRWACSGGWSSRSETCRLRGSTCASCPDGCSRAGSVTRRSPSGRTRLRHWSPSAKPSRRAPTWSGTKRTQSGSEAPGPWPPPRAVAACFALPRETYLPQARPSKIRWPTQRLSRWNGAVPCSASASCAGRLRRSARPGRRSCRRARFSKSSAPASGRRKPRRSCVESAVALRRRMS